MMLLCRFCPTRAKAMASRVINSLLPIQALFARNFHDSVYHFEYWE